MFTSVDNLLSPTSLSQSRRHRWSKASVGAEGEDVASPVLAADSTDCLCRDYSGPSTDGCRQQPARLTLGSCTVQPQRHLRPKSVNASNIGSKPFSYPPTVSISCRVADTHYARIITKSFIFSSISNLYYFVGIDKLSELFLEVTGYENFNSNGVSIHLLMLYLQTTRWDGQDIQGIKVKSLANNVQDKMWTRFNYRLVIFSSESLSCLMEF